MTEEMLDEELKEEDEDDESEEPAAIVPPEVEIDEAPAANVSNK